MGMRRRRSNSLWIYIMSLMTQVHSQIKVHSQIDRCRPEYSLSFSFFFLAATQTS